MGAATRGFQPGNEMYKLREKKPITDMIKRMMVQEEDGELDANRIRKGLEKVFDSASTGNLEALTFLRDTSQGKPAQALMVEDGDGKPAIGMIRMIVVQPDNSNVINELRTIEGIATVEKISSPENAASPTPPPTPPGRSFSDMAVGDNEAPPLSVQTDYSDLVPCFVDKSVDSRGTKD